MKKITFFLLALFSASTIFAQYCLPTYSTACTSGDLINSFTLNTISNTGTGCSSPSANNHTDYTATISTTLIQGSTHTVTCNPGTSWGQYFVIWIDFNQDGDFDEVNEFFDVGYSASGGSIATPITVPTGILNGTTRLRVMCHFGTGAINQPDACSAQTWGETEDYEVIIAPPLPEISTIFIAGTTDTVVNTCTQSGNPDTVIVDNSSTNGSSYSSIITDASGNIIALSTNDTTDFSSYPFGISRIYGVSHIDTLAPEATLIGLNVLTATLAPDSFILSSNFVEVIRWEDIVDGGMVSTISGDTITTTCTQDGTPDIVLFNTSSTSTANYMYFMTFADDTIRAVSGNSFDFDSIAPGTSHIYGVSYNGDFDSTVVDSIITNAVFSNGCYDISSNYIEIIHLLNNTDTSSVSEMVTNNTTVNLSCIGDGVSNLIEFTHVTPAAANYAYVITDVSGNILAFPSNNMVDFDSSGIGSCRVYGVSYNGNIDTLLIGANINSANISNACFTISNNWIEIIKTSVDGDSVVSPTATLDSILVDVTPIGNVITFTNTSTSTNDYTYVITDSSNTILEFNTGSKDFNGSSIGICYVYGLSYQGVLDSSTIGNDITTAILSIDCYDISTNRITITKAATLSVNTFNKKNVIAIYPNPAKESFKINGLNNELYKITIINTLGAVVIQEKEYQSSSDINISQLEAGIYFINIINNDGDLSSHKIVKE